MLPLAVYIHWPFCKAKCPYCDFNSHVRDKVNHPDWRDSYATELAQYREMTGPRRVTSVFFGGGTPSLMEPETVAHVIQSIDRLWGLPSGTEINLEANPTSVEAGKLQGFRAAGVNRVSLGVQALRDDALKGLGRQHSASEAMAAVKLAAGIFDRYSFDLIYARPGQTPDAWHQELNEAIAYGPSHLSLYQLTIEEGTLYHTLHARGEIVVPDEDTAADLYELTQETTAAAGLPAYEISNHARPGDESRHNLAYWRYQDYIGVGPGAHGRLTVEGQKLATRAHKVPEIWMDRVKQQRHGSHPFEVIDTFKQGEEMLMMGLRLRSGVALDEFEAVTHTPLSSFVDMQRLSALANEGLMELTDQHIRATAAGRQRLNALLAHLIV